MVASFVFCFLFKLIIYFKWTEVPIYKIKDKYYSVTKFRDSWNALFQPLMGTGFTWVCSREGYKNTDAHIPRKEMDLF